MMNQREVAQEQRIQELERAAHVLFGLLLKPKTQWTDEEKDDAERYRNAFGRDRGQTIERRTFDRTTKTQRVKI